jgi:hypothetical protein
MMHLSVFGRMLLQEVGFDVVSMWNQFGYLAKSAVIFLVLAVAGIILLIIARRARGN